jgi:phosphate-selective porin OprO and OprP
VRPILLFVFCAVASPEVRANDSEASNPSGAFFANFNVTELPWLFAANQIQDRESSGQFSVDFDSAFPRDGFTAFDNVVNRETLERRFTNWGRLYQSDKNPLVQDVWILGRYHGQHHWSDGNVGDSSGWETRRHRIGSQVQVLNNMTLHAQMVSGSDFQPFYNGFTELWTQWKFSDEVALTLGQQKHRFTHDRNVSSRYIATLERSQLVNMFNADYTPAITLQGNIQKFAYYTGLFSNATEQNMWDAFTQLNSGYSLLAATYYTLSEKLPVDSAHVGVSGVHSDANANATNLNVFRQGLASTLIFTKGPSSFVGETVAGLRSERGDAIGCNLQYGYFLTDRLQLVTRYQLAASNRADGLLAQLRYEQRAELTRGSQYSAVYLGSNYHLAGHRIKWMNGVEYSELSGDRLWTFSTMIRIFYGPHSDGPFPMGQTLTGRWR